ncbi:TBC1 domain family member 15-like [Limulus polyphemus]|uniref:TBC1 domain family member 15-like n=1 Tax=Limulus polyphemus TaxID=6850 RepID=A0ABM1BVW6_LIMPO|nr:TBC1 domain family member 15-like [Limulus polyphemus]
MANYAKKHQEFIHPCRDNGGSQRQNSGPGGRQRNKRKGLKIQEQAEQTVISIMVVKNDSDEFIKINCTGSVSLQRENKVEKHKLLTVPKDSSPTVSLPDHKEQLLLQRTSKSELFRDVREPLTSEEYERLLDEDGRIVDDHKLRQIVFRRGIKSDIRSDIWKFLFGFFPFHSTRREREVIYIDHCLQYQALKKRTAEFIRENNSIDLSPMSDSYDHDDIADSQNYKFTTVKESVAEFSDSAKDETKQLITSIKFLAEVKAVRLKPKAERLDEDIRMINKDVTRTDRDQKYFKGKNNPNLFVLKDILTTFIFSHEEIGYTQGMNDILSRFLVVLKTEVEAYWCFTRYVESVSADFQEEDSCDLGKLTFCHRWLLVGFKREFEFEEGLRLFEILSSHFLEMSSLEAEKVRVHKRRKSFEKEKELVCCLDRGLDLRLTFDLFVCVAILVSQRNRILKCRDAVEMFKCIAKLTRYSSLEEILFKAETLFFDYCQKSVVDSFQVIFH